MELRVRAPKGTIKPSTRAYAEEKIGRAVEKILGKDSSRVDVEIEDLANGTGAPMIRVKVNVFVPQNKSHVVSVDDPEVRAAIDLVADKITRTVKRSKNRRRDKTRSHEKLQAVIGSASTEQDEEESMVVTL